jgi:hypothetical protein
MYLLATTPGELMPSSHSVRIAFRFAALLRQWLGNDLTYTCSDSSVTDDVYVEFALDDLPVLRLTVSGAVGSECDLTLQLLSTPLANAAAGRVPSSNVQASARNVAKLIEQTRMFRQLAATISRLHGQVTIVGYDLNHDDRYRYESLLTVRTNASGRILTAQVVAGGMSPVMVLLKGHNDVVTAPYVRGVMPWTDEELLPLIDKLVGLDG